MESILNKRPSNYLGNSGTQRWKVRPTEIAGAGPSTAAHTAKFGQVCGRDPYEEPKTR
jgi:hypothetical protein